MRHPFQIAPETVASLQAQMTGGPMVISRNHDFAGNDDYPQLSHLARGFTKRAAMLEAQNHRCAYCGERMGENPLYGNFATIDEVHPRVAGGLRRWSNQVMACWLCNTGKGAMAAKHYFDLVQTLGRNKAFVRAGETQSKRDRRRIQRAMRPAHLIAGQCASS